MSLFEEYLYRFPPFIIKELCNIKQDSFWHKEGNLINHVKLVFEEVEKLEPKNNDLYVCAMFHDLGKINTTSYVMKDGMERVHAYGHESLTDHYIDKYIFFFEDLNINVEKIREVCSLHMYAHEYNSGKIKNRKKIEDFLSKKYINDILDFAGCDGRGRIQ